MIFYEIVVCKTRQVGASVCKISGAVSVSFMSIPMKT